MSENVTVQSSISLSTVTAGQQAKWKIISLETFCYYRAVLLSAPSGQKISARFSSVKFHF